MNQIHYAIIGGGINGLAVARQILLDKPHARVTVFEKEAAVAMHQSSHNSGVVHAGLYYEPGSLKARLCRRGVELVRDYCLTNQLPYDQCGKVVVALAHEEEGRLENIYQRSIANEVPGVRMLEAQEIQSVEPNCIGVSALHSPETAIVSYQIIAQTMANEIISRGGDVLLQQSVYALTQTPNGIEVKLENNQIHPTRFDYAVSCCGLQSDRLAQQSGDEKTPRIIPFFGQYYVIDATARNEVKGLIYPVPDPQFPFLGVHFTKRIDGEMTIGPNAFIAFGREDYAGGHVNLKDMWDYLSYPGFWKFALKNGAATIRESKTVLSPDYFLKEAAKYVPKLRHVAIKPATRGIRAQAMNANGHLEDDFVIRQQGNITHIRNAPSPGATSSMAIGEYIVREIMNH
ncbi:L-2-hydroxyglutarate oxidase [Snodgrassella sp. CFCC 13594]|uniref:L-2-hydroxyglutarate oxidase n=1 Tax=Snodgrassella sp. CFCC 13594 TaxID=1775559 RepID=UPI000831B7AC|nr:L-2-hydroxyglutarate oxidase [Snodgrassella sp. CFCC 13594]